MLYWFMVILMPEIFGHCELFWALYALFILATLAYELTPIILFIYLGVLILINWLFDYNLQFFLCGLLMPVFSHAVTWGKRLRWRFGNVDVVCPHLWWRRQSDAAFCNRLLYELVRGGWPSMSWIQLFLFPHRLIDILILGLSCKTRRLLLWYYHYFCT